MSATRVSFGVVACLLGVAALPAMAEIRILRQPASVVVEEGCSARFSVEAEGTPWLYYQWLRDGAPIPGAIASEYVIPRVTLADSGARFSVDVFNFEEMVSSSNAYLQVSVDVTPPSFEQLLGCAGQQNTLIVRFRTMCGGLNKEQAEDFYNYQLSGSAMVLSAELLHTGVDVLLHTAGLLDGVTYPLRMENIQDVFGNIAPSIQITFIAGRLPPPIQIVQQPQDRSVQWGQQATFGVAAQSAFTNLTYQWERGSTPINGATQASLTLPRAHSCAESGFFRCRIASEDCAVYSRYAQLVVFCDCEPPYLQSVVPLSTHDGLIVEFDVPVIPYTATDVFNYEIGGLEILYGEMMDNRRVLLRTTHQTPGQLYTMVVNEVSNYSDPSCGRYKIPVNSTIQFRAASEVEIVEQPLSITSQVDCRASFSVVARVQPPTNIISYQWQVNGADIPGANGPTYRTGFLKGSDHGTLYRCRVSAPGVEVTSEEALLTLGGDVVPPFVEGAFATASNQVTVIFNHPVVPGDVYNYQLSPPGAVLSVALAAHDPTLVILETSVIANRVTVEDILDQSGNRMLQAATVDVVRFGTNDLQARLAGRKLIVHWPSAEWAVLQSASSPQGPWVDLADAVTPLVLDARANWCSGLPYRGQEFFRLRYDP